MKTVYIVSGARTPLGAFQGTLSSLTAPQLGAHSIKEALARGQIDPAWVEEVLMGCVLTGGMGQAPARQASLGAGLSNSIPCSTVNKVCGSGMKTIMMAAQAVKAGDADLIVAGGMESMSNAPYSLDRARTGYRMGNGTLTDLMIHDGLWDPYNQCHMGTCGDETAAEFNISREALDAFSAESVKRAQAASANGRLAQEIVPIEIKGKKGEVTVVDKDEQPTRANPEKLPSLRPAFGADGVTTAGNSSSINDGAAALVIASEEAVKAHDLKPIAKIIGYSQHAQEPKKFTSAPIKAIEKLLKAHSSSVAEIDLFEVNEAFAVVAMISGKELGIPHEKLNVNGGAVALGHPIGMTGARLVLTAAYELKNSGKHRAICSPCIGGGEATAILIERC